jgi:putative membrane protein
MISKHIVVALAVLGTLEGTSRAWAADVAAGGKFIKEAIQGNLAEVKAGQLAQQKGASQGVKDFGTALVSDHQAANESATRIAQKMNVTAPE